MQNLNCNPTIDASIVPPTYSSIFNSESAVTQERSRFNNIPTDYDQQHQHVYSQTSNIVGYISSTLAEMPAMPVTERRVFEWRLSQQFCYGDANQRLRHLAARWTRNEPEVLPSTNTEICCRLSLICALCLIVIGFFNIVIFFNQGGNFVRRIGIGLLCAGCGLFVSIFLGKLIIKYCCEQAVFHYPTIMERTTETCSQDPPFTIITPAIRNNNATTEAEELSRSSVRCSNRIPTLSTIMIEPFTSSPPPTYDLIMSATELAIASSSATDCGNHSALSHPLNTLSTTEDPNPNLILPRNESQVSTLQSPPSYDTFMQFYPTISDNREENISCSTNLT